jgi:hypothetical protein
VTLAASPANPSTMTLKGEFGTSFLANSTLTKENKKKIIRLLVQNHFYSIPTYQPTLIRVALGQGPTFFISKNFLEQSSNNMHHKMSPVSLLFMAFFDLM